MVVKVNPKMSPSKLRRVMEWAVKKGAVIMFAPGTYRCAPACRIHPDGKAR